MRRRVTRLLEAVSETQSTDDSSVLSRFKLAVFRDDIGLLIFLLSIVFFGVTARLDFSITDTFALANTLVTISEFDIAVRAFYFGPDSGQMPGMYYSEGKVVGRNYGQLAMALPVYYVLLSLSFLIGLQPILVGLWSVALYGLLAVGFEQFGWGTDRLAGALTLPVLIGNILVSDPLQRRLVPYVALMVTVMLIAALIGVLLYRLTLPGIGQRPAAAVGIAVNVATPVAIFASIPKRHSFTVFFLLAGMFLLYKSEATDSRVTRGVYRGLTYATVGGLTWIHAAEGLVLLIALVAGDIVSRRKLGVVELLASLLGLTLSLVPFLITNHVATGNPIKPPRLLPPYEGQELATNPDGASGPSTGGSTPSGESSGSATPGGRSSGGSTPDGESSGGGGFSVVTAVEAILSRLLAAVSNVQSWVQTLAGATLAIGLKLRSQVFGMVPIATDTQRMWDIFVRRGFVNYNFVNNNPESINLSLLESFPLLPYLLTVVSSLRDRGRRSIDAWSDSPYAAVDTTAFVFVLILTVISLKRLPADTSFTVRYLHPVYPVAVYYLVRIPKLRVIFVSHLSTIVRTYGATVALCVPLYLAGLWAFAAVLGEAVQMYATVAFVVGVAVFLIWAVALVHESERLDRLVAGSLGFTFGMGTVYTVAFGVAIYGSKRQLLPVIEELSRIVGV